MITREQAGKAADGILDQPKAELGDRQDKRARLVSAERRRLESPLIPALIAAFTTITALSYLDNVLICALLGAAVGGLFGWAARRS